MTSEPVRLVCFDLGGVLVRIARDWADACRRAEVDASALTPDVLERHHALMLRYETGEIDEAGYFHQIPACVPQVAPDAIARVFDAWLLGMYPGAEQLIDDLRAAGVRTACLSNTNHRHWRTLRERPGAYGALDRLDHKFISYELRVMKPHPDAYRAVERGTGMTGSEILFFDDRPENVEAAQALGWRAVKVDRVDDAVSQIREHIDAHGLLGES